MLGIAAVGPLGPPPDAPEPGCAPSHHAAGTERADGLDRLEREAWALLASPPCVGPRLLIDLVAWFGSARRALETARLGRDGSALLDAVGGERALTPDAAREIADRVRRPELVLEPIERLGLRVVLTVDSDYPVRLLATELPPPVLFVRGQPDALDPDHAVAVVGTRRPTDANRALAMRLATRIAEAGATLISGLAIGIDGAAHAAIVAAGGRTVGVLGGGHDRLYPRSHAGLAGAMVDAGGAVISEYAPNEEPLPWSFPRRNRVISGLADAVVVIQAPRRSGALSTAQWALEQGRPTYVVPGRIGEAGNLGGLEFLRANAGIAQIVASEELLLDDLALDGASRRRAPSGRVHLDRLGLSSVERRLAQLLHDDAHTVDALVRELGLPVATVLGALTMLETRGLVGSAYGRYRPTPALASAIVPRAGGTRARTAS